MDVSALKAKIQTKNIPSYLIFTGDEWKIQEIYIQQIAKALEKDIRRVDTLQEVYDSLRSKSFIKTSYIYVIRDSKELMQNEKVQQQISAGILKENVLIHLITNIDKRTKFYKQYTNDIIVFERLSDTLLRKYILKEINLSERNIKRLIAICEHDYGRILLEIDKIRRYADVCND